MQKNNYSVLEQVRDSNKLIVLIQKKEEHKRANQTKKSANQIKHEIQNMKQNQRK